jgi:hypothetical protein
MDNKKMKKLYFKLISTSLIIVVFVSFYIKSEKFITNDYYQTKNRSIIFRSSFNSSIAFFDPNSILYPEEALLSYHLYSALVMFDQNGQITTELASDFHWDNDSLVFTFDSNLRTSGGSLITAEDAAISIKRLMTLRRKATHGDLTRILCPDYDIKTPFDVNCPGVRVQANKLVLTPYNKKYIPFLLPLLASPEVRIIPKLSIDEHSFKIKNWKDTTGAYFLLQDSPKGEIILKANTNYKFYNKNMPEIINFSNLEYGIDNISEDNTDVMTSNQTLLINEVDSLLKSDKYNAFHTHKINLAYIMFSKNAIRDFSISQRLTLGKIIGDQLKTMFGSPFYGQEDTVSFFQDFSEGNLSLPQIENLNQLRINTNDQTWKRKPRIGVRPKSLPFWEKSFQEFKDKDGASFFEFIPITEEYHLIPESKKPDTYINFTDTGFYEDFSLISYQLKYGGFQLSEQEADQWIHDYINIEDKSQRSKKLQNLHYHILVNAYIYPIFKRPYTTIYKKSFTQQFSKFNLSTRLWHLRM